MKDLRAEVAKWRKAGETVALVPTMGYLHDGHVSLLRLGRTRGDLLIMDPLFVNPDAVW